MAKENKNQGGLERELNKPFQKLRKAIGQKVRVDYVRDASRECEVGTLIETVGYCGIRLGKIETGFHAGIGLYIPFIGQFCAIQRVISKKGNILYENLNISDSYKAIDAAERVDLVARTFGQNIAYQECMQELLDAEKLLKSALKYMNE